ncbi:MAG: protoporphyrinogen oxidase [Mangrovibacterium sp.]
MKVAVIGAGLTGLTTAWYLKKRGFDVYVFEKAGRPGGVIHSENRDGFVYENGPSTGVLGTPEAVELFEELEDLCTLEIADRAAKFRWIWKDGCWHAMPSGLIGGITTPLFRFSDKLRLLGEPFRKPGTNPDESLASLVRRRMGESFLNYAVDPFVLGIYSGDPEKLVPRYALPRLYRLEQQYGSFIGGAIKKARESGTEQDKKVTREIFSVKGGLSRMIEALVCKIGAERIRLNCEHLRVSRFSDGTYAVGCRNTEPSRYDRVISTVGAYALRELFGFLPGRQLSRIERMPYARVVQVSVGFRQWEGMTLKAFGGLIPFCENRPLLGTLFLSSFLKGRAPGGGALLSTFLGGIRRPEMLKLSDTEITRLVKEEFKLQFGLTKVEPDLLVINRYEHAIPQYGTESADKLQAVRELEQQYAGLILGGNFRDGIGMADRIRQGSTLAQQLS